MNTLVRPTPPAAPVEAAAPRVRAGRAPVIGLLLLNGSLIAGIYACGKIAGAAGASALGILAWQVACAALLVSAVVRLRGGWMRPDARMLRYAAIAGALGVAAPNFVTFTVLAYLPAGVVGVVVALSPLFTWLIARAAGVERGDPLRAFGLLLGLAGVVFLLWPGASADAAWSGWTLLALATPLCLAAANVYRSVAWPAGLSPLNAAALLLGVLAVALVPAAVLLGQWVMPGTLGPRGDVALAGAGLLTALFYLSAFELQKRGGPVVAGQLGYVITLASLAIGAGVLGERYPASTLLAAGVVLSGVGLVNLRAGGRQP